MSTNNKSMALCLPCTLGCLPATAAIADAPLHTLSIKKSVPSVKLISNVVFSQVQMRGYSNVALKMDILQPE